MMGIVKTTTARRIRRRKRRRRTTTTTLTRTTTSATIISIFITPTSTTIISTSTILSFTARNYFRVKSHMGAHKECHMVCALYKDDNSQYDRYQLPRLTNELLSDIFTFPELFFLVKQ